MDASGSLRIANVRIEGDSELRQVVIEEGVIRSIQRQDKNFAADLDAEGGLLVPSLVDPHVHLDAVLTEGFPAPNYSGTLIEGIERWSQRKPYLTEEDVITRAEEAIRWHMGQGVLKIRSHVDICDPNLTALKALITVRERVRDVVTLQLVAFPQDGIFCFPDGPELMDEAMRLGADVVGGIPHYEWTREDGIRDVEYAFKLAEKYDKPIDIHCDETDDDQSRFVETMAKLAYERGWGQRVTASHTTAMGSYNDAYAFKLIRILARSGMAIVANPLDNVVLQGRFDTYPKRRGMTRVKELMAAGVPVAAGHDSIMDPWYPLGTGSQLFVASMLAHVGQLTGTEELKQCFNSITYAGARVMGLEDYGVAEGKKADLVIFDVPTSTDAIRLLPRPRWVIAGGRVVASTPPMTTDVLWNGIEQRVSYLR
ncbi:cytosine deaminase [Sulfobacillus sp. hq2]|uniref:cytosine deaminase n=1 Tax=Sulfobacillus sp. hq2 TaxID=2039167 RepID=UPI000CD0C7E7|nr:cytosine deaminase [Sulfobacillus sp. hq2]POB10585.1 cytosine deaminase [Sulfobacillus sp. hq2]